MPTAIGIDIGTSGLRILVVNSNGKIIYKNTVRFTNSKGKYQIWDNQGRINLERLEQLIITLFEESQHQIRNKIDVIGISGFGPSLVFLDEEGQPQDFALTYAYRGAEQYLSELPQNFQKRTGGLRSASLPFVQLLEKREQKSKFTKLTNILDYLVWRMTGLSIDSVFVSLPNASYTGFYSLKEETWDLDLLNSLGIMKEQLPKIVHLGTKYHVSDKIRNDFPFLENSMIVTGAIDGLDAFWATQVNPQDKIIVGSASTTGALRVWEKKGIICFKSPLIQYCHVLKDDWVKLIPFNNVGTSLHWLANFLLDNNRAQYLDENRLNINKLENNLFEKLNQQLASIEQYLSSLPLYFPYIEGEPRGPHGRGKKIKGGFINRNFLHDDLDLYLATQIGIVNMYRHNFDVLDLSSGYHELRITGEVAKKSELFLILLEQLLEKRVVHSEKIQSVAWTVAMRGLLYIDAIQAYPPISFHHTNKKTPFFPKKVLEHLYTQYLEIYNNPFQYHIES